MRQLLAFIILLGSSCTLDQTPKIPWKPDFYNWKYQTNVSIDGSEINFYLNAVKGSISNYQLDFYRSLPDYSYYYHIGMSVTPAHSGTYILHSISEGNSWAFYSELCCFGTPDQVNWTYNIYDEDSVNNYISIHLDSITNDLSGMFKCTMVRINEPFDTIHIQCDSFYCQYSI